MACSVQWNAKGLHHFTPTAINALLQESLVIIIKAMIRDTKQAIFLGFSLINDL